MTKLYARIIMSYPMYMHDITNAYIEGYSDDQILNILFDGDLFETMSVEV